MGIKQHLVYSIYNVLPFKCNGAIITWWFFFCLKTVWFYWCSASSCCDEEIKRNGPERKKHAFLSNTVYRPIPYIVICLISVISFISTRDILKRPKGTRHLIIDIASVSIKIEQMFSNHNQLLLRPLQSPVASRV